MLFFILFLLYILFHQKLLGIIFFAQGALRNFYYNLFSRIKGTKTKKSTDFIYFNQNPSVWPMRHSLSFNFFSVFWGNFLHKLSYPPLSYHDVHLSKIWNHDVTTTSQRGKCKKLSPSQKKHSLYLAKP